MAGREGAYSLEAAADAVAAYLTAAGVVGGAPCAAADSDPSARPRLALVGYSLGARLALVLTARHGSLFDAVRRGCWPCKGVQGCRTCALHVTRYSL
jgi:pimeloyl-ACP methyl ester carboxylesterase